MAEKTTKTEKRVRKRYEDMTPEEKAEHDKRNAPKPAYIVYLVNGDGSIDIKLISRDSDEVLAAVDADRSLRYQRFLIK